MSSMGADGRRQSREELEEQVSYLEAEINDLRHRLTETPGGGSRSMELRRKPVPPDNPLETGRARRLRQETPRPLEPNRSRRPYH